LKPKENYLSIGIRSHFKGTFQKPNTDPAKNVMDTLYMVKENDFLVNITFAWEGALAIVPKEDEGGLVSHRFPTYTFEKDKVLNSFFKYSFFREKSKHQLGIVSPGGAGRNRVMNKKDFVKLKFLIPTLTEQKRIANFFTVLDNKINQLKEKKALLGEYKKGMMQKIFSQEVRFKPAYDKSSAGRDENGNNYPEWEEKMLGEIATFLKGKGISKNDISINGKTDCIRYGELYTHYNEIIFDIISKTNIDIKNLVLSKENDVIIPASGEDRFDIATASCILKSDIAIGGDLNIIRTANNGIFLSYYLNSIKKMEIANLAQGVSVVHLYSSQLSTLKVDIPSITEQTKIANFLSKIDDKIKTVNEQIEESKEYKKGLLQRMYCV
jgi:type I restriction enzyme S subunit